MILFLETPKKIALTRPSRLALGPFLFRPMSTHFSLQTDRQSTPTCTLVNAHETGEATVEVAALVLFTWEVSHYHHRLLLDQSQTRKHTSSPTSTPTLTSQTYPKRHDPNHA